MLGFPDCEWRQEGALPSDLVNGVTERQDLRSLHVSIVQVVGKGPQSRQVKARSQIPPDRVTPDPVLPSPVHQAAVVSEPASCHLPRCPSLDWVTVRSTDHRFPGSPCVLPHAIYTAALAPSFDR